jgi:hypothetical protein
MPDDRICPEVFVQLVQRKGIARISIAEIDSSIEKFFATPWKRLDKNTLKETSTMAGVYMIAFTAETVPRMHDIIYVGETHGHSQGLRKRLSQFLQGVENGSQHSGAETFFILNSRRPFSTITASKVLYFIDMPLLKRRIMRDLQPQYMRLLEKLIILTIIRSIGTSPKLNTEWMIFSPLLASPFDDVSASLCV